MVQANKFSSSQCQQLNQKVQIISIIMNILLKLKETYPLLYFSPNILFFIYFPGFIFPLTNLTNQYQEIDITQTF